LRAYQVDNFDTWAGNFGESVTALELSPDGSGYRMQTRFAKFVNLPELMSLFSEVADIRTREMLNLPTPVARLETVAATPSQRLIDYVQSLVKRAEKIRLGSVSPHEDNMLSVTNDGRKAALDMRLVDPFAVDDDNGGKVNLCARTVHRIWQRTVDSRGTQLVFCDLSTPKPDGQFSVYNDLRRKLADLGIPNAEMAFIHDYESDASKKALFRAVREGKIRIMFGSTGMMGTGTNVQTRLVALHHLDAPWRPSDVEQRDGRGIRQGNLSEEVEIYRYVTAQSFDAYMWQTLETKARFIAQVMSGAAGLRSAEDVELAALSYAEVKALASGNPMVLEKAGVDAELAKISLMKSKWEETQWRNRQEVASLPTRVTWLEREIERVSRDIERRDSVGASQRVIKVSGVPYPDREEAGAALMKAFTLTSLGRGEQRVIGQYAGFDLALHNMYFGKSLTLEGGISYKIGNAETHLGFARAVSTALASMEDVREEYLSRIAATEKRLADLTLEIAKPFDKAGRLLELRERQREIEAELDLSRGDFAAAEELAEAA
jgi:hypothetical protein